MVPSRPANFNRSSPFLTSLRDPEGQRNSLSRCSGDTGFAQLCGFCLPMDAMGSRAAFRKVGHPFFYSKNQHIPQVDPSRTLDLKHVCHGTCQRCGSQFSSSRPETGTTVRVRACVHGFQSAYIQRVGSGLHDILQGPFECFEGQHSLRKKSWDEPKIAKDRESGLQASKWLVCIPKKRGFLIE